MGEYLPAYRVRKGDVVGVHVGRSSTSLAGTTRSTYWIVGEVTRATRDGWAAEVCWATTGGWTSRHQVPVPGRKTPGTIVIEVTAVPREKIRNRDYLLAAVAGREFDDIDQARAALRPYIT